MTFTSDERSRIAALADVLIPAANGRLSASHAHVEGDGLDQYLIISPATSTSLRQLLNLTATSDPVTAIANLREKHPEAFAMFGEFAAGAYFLNPAVRQAIGYTGQTARPIDPSPDYLDNNLLQSVIDRGPIYRPTPTKDSSP